MSLDLPTAAPAAPVAPASDSASPDAAAATSAATGARLRAGVVDVFDMHCAACAVLIEDGLQALPGVRQVRVHYATQRAHVEFDPGQIDLPAVIAHIERLGYGANQVAGLSQAQIERLQRRQRIWQFGLASFLAMQIMMLSVPRFLAGEEMEQGLSWLIDWGALLLTLPVLWVRARGFYRGALRELRLRRMGMDTAISFAILAAFAGSVWHMWLSSSSLYFDSVAMFVAFLLGVRWLEWEQRQSNLNAIRKAAHVAPQPVVRLDAQDRPQAPVAIEAIAVGDRLWITPGEAFPVDGELLSEVADCDESLLSGESRPLRRLRGDTLVAGAINCGGAVAMRALATAADSTQARLLATAEAASKPETLALADCVARYFMPLLLLLTLAALLINWPQGPTVAIERAIAVLIISCPCALALAAPGAFARGFAGLLSRGVVVRRGQALERLAQVDHFLLDKTGTLTVPNVARVSALRPGWDEARALNLIAALERAANHPLAAALQASAPGPLPQAEDLQWSPRTGVSGRVGGVQYQFGRGEAAAPAAEDDGALWLTDEQGVVCRVDMGERLRDEAPALVQGLRRCGEVEILSGDQREAVARVAGALDIDRWRARCSPQDKAERLQQLQQAGRRVAMIGDGINDSITLAGADVSIAVASAADAARANADLICLDTDLRVIDEAVRYVHRLRRIVVENFCWAGGYNLLAIPFAVLGWVNPLLASAGMAASSAIVMLNVQRLSIRKRPTTVDGT